ncbi:D-alanine--D-alanine ligase [Bradyrhizobium sp. CCGB12]|uniref:D-alanine--D-alanine ligase family protein n=1 Tax=Bradyrhizobium sp. CCGB12 TaxID=2949632 RepID=UPI0020B1D6BF|nr:D-alanine--D-alanine ligase family protein [Bradyrhizobium sp. CCGB12]MCP3392219.1 D-alanine--D-alanine ligase [Bradyrhizobium sp. CCGB12]
MTMLNVALIFGGRSADRDISMRSARYIYEALDRQRYNPILVGVAHDGKWWLQENAREFPLHVDSSGAQITFLAGGGGKALVYTDNGCARTCQVDVVFPLFQEGILEGLLERAQVPFVGSRFPAPAICMDKHITKRILRDAGFSVARFLASSDREEVDFQFAQKTLGSRSLFVKPASFHSSIGVSKVSCEAEFEAAIDLAFSYGRKVIIEEYVQARELACAVLEDAIKPSKLLCSWPNEIIPTGQDAFFTHRTKIDGKGLIVKIKAELDETVADLLRGLACEAFRAIGCEAFGRVDFFMRPNGDVLINEVGTFPSLKPFSMFPKMMRELGFPYKVLIQRLIENAIGRAERVSTEL